MRNKNEVKLTFEGSRTRDAMNYVHSNSQVAAAGKSCKLHNCATRPLPIPFLAIAFLSYATPVTYHNINTMADSHIYANLSQLHGAKNNRPPTTRHHRVHSGHHLQSLKNSKEDEVDQLTDLLVQTMGSSSDPDFFGICTKCKQKVLGEGSGCTAMGNIYHVRCFTCQTCCKQLRGLQFYNVDGSPLCEEDYLDTLEKCSVCYRPITDRILRATGKPYHPDCFTCVVCHKCLDGIPFTVDNVGKIHCIEDFHRKFAPRCFVCSNSILPEPGQHETVRVVALDRSYHVNCYRCEDCQVQLTSEGEGRGCYPLDDHILCRSCNAERVNALTA